MLYDGPLGAQDACTVKQFGHGMRPCVTKLQGPMAENFLQARADTDMQIAQLRSLSEDSEIGRLGGVPPAERVFMYLQVS
jgi:hypothetical protein